MTLNHAAENCATEHEWTIEQEIAWHGGSASRDQLKCWNRYALRKAQADGRITRVGRRYVLSDTDLALREAARHSAARSHLSAALKHGWPVAVPPTRPHIMIPGNRHPPRSARAAVHCGPLSLGELASHVTDPCHTVTDCARALPFAEALAVADSALRAGAVQPEELDQLARRVKGPGAEKVRRVLRHASPKPYNPFESVLRALCIEVYQALDQDTRLRPQVTITTRNLRPTVDLADESLRLVIEADGFEWHSGPEAFSRDCRRYDELTTAGWMVLRFTWPHVFRDPEWVAQTVRDAVRACHVRATAVRSTKNG